MGFGNFYFLRNITTDADGHEYHTNVMMNGAQIKICV